MKQPKTPKPVRSSELVSLLDEACKHLEASYDNLRDGPLSETRYQMQEAHRKMRTVRHQLAG